MPIVSLKQLKERYRGILAGETGDDEILEECIDRAQDFLEAASHRVLEPFTMKRMYKAPADGGACLLVDIDLLSVSQVINGDGEVLTPHYWYLEPLNGYPKHAICTKNGAYWTSDESEGEFIQITGKWGFAAPATRGYAAAQQAVVYMAAYIYTQRDAQQFDVTSFVEGGAITVPDGIPRSVQEWLKRASRILV